MIFGGYEQHLYMLYSKSCSVVDIPVIVWGECPQREYGAGRPEDANLKYFDRRVLEEYGSLNGLRVSDLTLIDGVSEEIYSFILS